MNLSSHKNIVLLVFSVCYCDVLCKKLPSFIEYCHQSDPKIYECFKRAVETIRPRLLQGVPELLIPPMNPLVLQEASIDNGDSFKATFRNIEITHADDFTLNDLKVDLPNNHVEIDLSFRKLRIRSVYNVNGRILVFQLSGQGPADGNFTNVSGKLVLDGTRYMKDGREHINWGNRSLDLKLGKPVFWFDGIFKDNPELSERTNELVNQNILEVMDELRPVIDKTVSQFIFGVVDRIFDRYAFDELFPPN